MTERRLLALLALLMGILGAILVLLDFRLPGGNTDFLNWLVGVAVEGILALAAIVGSLLIYGGQYRFGGILNVVLAVALLLVGADLGGLALIFFSGILGIAADGTYR